MHKKLLTYYLDMENVISLDLHLINGEVIKVQERMKDTENKTLHIVQPKDRVVNLDHVLYFDINIRNERNTDSPYPS
ncbi:hypothetical protein ACN9US_08100 [Staphylococcus caprae]|uniref:hypothetical protein n=1 Tax=Staphylococcus caprae TaxID=29380 RepID=UPI003B21B404